MADFNIQLKIIELGAIKTDFYGHSRACGKPDYTDSDDNVVENAKK